ncbi:MAG TPA: fluoride efflux transporter CrcB [Nitrospiria bacterium]|jgi:CrcB protein
MTFFQKLIWIGTAGALGTLVRYGLSGFIQKTFGFGFPWGTLLVNMMGCFLFGLFWSLAEHRFTFGGEVRMIVLVGFLGSFTTFSSFAFETSQLLRDSQWLMAMGNLMAQNLIGITTLFLGLFLGRLL